MPKIFATVRVKSRILSRVIYSAANITEAGGPEVNTWYVNNSGSNSAIENTPQTPYLTIQAAHDVAAPGDIIMLQGEYSSASALAITKDISIASDNKFAEIGNSVTVNAAFAQFYNVVITGNITEGIAGLVFVSKCEIQSSGSQLTVFIASEGSTINLDGATIGILEVKGGSAVPTGAVVPVVTNNLRVSGGSEFLIGIDSSNIADCLLSNCTIDGDFTHGGDTYENSVVITGTVNVAGTRTINNQGGGGVALQDGIGTKFNVDKIDLVTDDLPSDIIWTRYLGGGAENIFYHVAGGTGAQSKDGAGVINEYFARPDIAFMKSIGPGSIGAAIAAYPTGYIILEPGVDGYTFKGLKYKADYGIIDWAGDGLLIPHQDRVIEIGAEQGWGGAPQFLALGAFNPAMTFNTQGDYDNYTLVADTIVTASSIVAGLYRAVYITQPPGGTFKLQGGAGISITTVASSIIATEFVLLPGSYMLHMASLRSGPTDPTPAVQANMPDGKLVAQAFPTITSLTISADNTYADLLISEGVYGDIAATNPVIFAKLSIIFAANGGTATDWIGSSVKQNDNVIEGSASALVGGETTLRIFGAITGTADGQETLTIGPLDAVSMFNASGNAMSASETGVDNLQISTGYIFANTHEMVVDASGEGVIVLNDNCYPSDGAGNDEDVSFEFWIETHSNFTAPPTYLVSRDDNDASVFITIAADTGERVAVQFIQGANIIRRRSLTTLSVSTLHHVVVTKTGEILAGIKIYIDGTEVSYSTWAGAGTYTGLAALVGNLQLDLGNSIGGTTGLGNYQIYRQFNAELTSGEVTTLYNAGTPIGLDLSLQTKCAQENLFNNTPDADNIGVNGTNQGTVTYQLI